jgi:hypothetical protein
MSEREMERWKERKNERERKGERGLKKFREERWVV